MAPASGDNAGGAPGVPAVRGFKVLRLPLAPGSPISRSLLVKEHQDRNHPSGRRADGRTLFVTHLDNFITEAQLSRCFANCFGPVEKADLKSTEKRAPRGEHRADHVKTRVNFAHVVFKERASLEKLLDAATGRIVGTAVLQPPPSELKEQIRSSKRLYPDPVALRREIDEWMLRYDQNEEAKRREQRDNMVDEDGFTKVGSGITRDQDGTTVVHPAKRADIMTGAFGEPIRGMQDPAAAVDSGGSRRRKKRPREKPDFYRFQLREKMRGEVVDYRKTKAEAEEKVGRMRKARRFKAPEAAS